MASPMVMASTNAVPDPQKQGKFALHISDRITQHSTTSGGFSSVKYNYKPRQTENDRKSTISTSDQQRYGLSLTDGKDTKYTYSGQRTNLKRTYALVFDQESHSCTLEPLSSSYTFNLRSTPAESSGAKLKDRYKQLQPKVEPVDEKNKQKEPAGEDEADPDESADENNPYDFRHYLNQARARDASRSVSPATSAVNTPRLGSVRGTPLLQSSQSKKPMIQRPTQPAPAQSQKLKRKTSPPPKPTTTTKTPTVRLERKASTRPSDIAGARKKIERANAALASVKPRATAAAPSSSSKSKEIKSDYYVHESSSDEDEDDNADMAGGLEIDFGESSSAPPAAKKQQTLPSRSAANSASPASFVETGTPQLFADLGPGAHVDFIDFDEDDPPGESDDSEYDDIVTRDNAMNETREDRDADGDADGDVDVEPIELGPPAHDHRNSIVDAHLGAVGEEDESEDGDGDEEHDADDDDDDEFDLEAEMMQELAGQAEEEAREMEEREMRRVDESSESEAD
ncbi:hypothetical protein K402DRAFT_466138 [Aulographum hederae CBS 113979]|uniref:Transcription elongation factor Eaf N-terminal domain-containing protein n=1 Tax=Aulographum hederae CBS 113979 TaxID=1176131 RepID=A0A6G1GR93_9PEZI|nr:hypothetical protein K402DRAFT_466138 [Aulographum hederae CBS 113979]